MTVGLTAALAGGFLLFGKKKDTKEEETPTAPTINDKDVNDGDLFI